ncbi:MAG TPA: BadF/BadG/BcrA/BcrD ATPase family protein [Candidatus Acidoferrum sp.]|nr:BadF/BadG/BcrA/BcrD ATPase family protein [Candidatus Acidoferrum sp.]
MWDEQITAQPPYYLGFDGGGTKTDCVLADSTGTVLKRATAGPSNPLRAGYAKAWFTLSDAGDTVLERQHLKSDDIRGICAGIGGAGRESVANKLKSFLERSFPGADVEVTTDVDITLEAAVGKGEGAILIVGTGSSALARNSDGRTARAGGRGPWFSDEGSAFDIGRRALNAVVRAEELRGPETELSTQILKWLDSRDWSHVLDWVSKNPDDVFPRVYPLVARLADKGDAVSQGLLTSAADSLAGLVGSVLTRLAMDTYQVPVSLCGGTLRRSKFFDAAIEESLRRVAPLAQVSHLQARPAEAAARRAIRREKQRANAAG